MTGRFLQKFGDTGAVLTVNCLFVANCGTGSGPNSGFAGYCPRVADAYYANSVLRTVTILFRFFLRDIITLSRMVTVGNRWCLYLEFPA